MANWQIDPDHSVASFRVRHMMITYVHGQYNKLSGSASFNPDAPTDLSLEVTVDAAGIYTGIKQRDGHLLSPDFFDSASFPVITYKSTGYTGTIKQGRLSGELTIRNTTRPVTLDLTFSGPLKGPEDFGGETVLGITASTTIKREEFGITWNVPMADSGLMVGRDIEIELNIEADLEK